jgi:hypothetical protein
MRCRYCSDTIREVDGSPDFYLHDGESPRHAARPLVREATPLLGSLVRSGFGWMSKDRRWHFGRMESTRLWHVWEGEPDDDFPAFGERFETLRAAMTKVERHLEREAEVGERIAP